jgi:hypothetical protein
MAKDSFWFRHEYNARDGEEILELRSKFGAEGYGVFWMLMEKMAENENGGIKVSLIGGLSHGFGVAKERLMLIIEECVSLELLFEKDGFYFNRMIAEHKEERRFFAEKGRSGAKKRWGGYSGTNKDANSGGYAENRTEQNINSNLSEKAPVKRIFPKLEIVEESFLRNGGTKEMAAAFFSKHSAMDWEIKGHPIKNWMALVATFIANWHYNNSKNAKHSKSHTENKLHFDKP